MRGKEENSERATKDDGQTVKEKEENMETEQKKGMPDNREEEHMNHEPDELGKMLEKLMEEEENKTEENEQEEQSTITGKESHGKMETRGSRTDKIETETKIALREEETNKRQRKNKSTTENENKKE